MVAKSAFCPLLSHAARLLQEPPQIPKRQGAWSVSGINMGTNLLTFDGLSEAQFSVISFVHRTSPAPGTEGLVIEQMDANLSFKTIIPSARIVHWPPLQYTAGLTIYTTVRFQTNLLSTAFVLSNVDTIVINPQHCLRRHK